MGTRNKNARGVGYIELLVALAVLAVVATAAIPLATWDDKRRREKRLRAHLAQMRQAIDTYKAYADARLVELEDPIEQLGYPPDLETLAEGVEVGDPNSPFSETIRLLPKVPVDPFTGEATWGLRSYQDDWDSRSWGRENVYDVYSLSEKQALDGTWYRDW